MQKPTTHVPAAEPDPEPDPTVVDRVFGAILDAILNNTFEEVVFHNRSRRYQRWFLIVVGLSLGLCLAMMIYHFVSAQLWNKLDELPMAPVFLVLFLAFVLIIFFVIGVALQLPGFRNVHRRNPRRAPVLRAVRASAPRARVGAATRPRRDLGSDTDEPGGVA
ncbi:hypothetical protein [Actinomycetospora sp. CA-053990]|uniref:hypothetical protein n=1 Tax=Actinomycetospora sp. CA-053990 TaxID=3239891 RepID=UPI003D8FB44F